MEQKINDFIVFCLEMYKAKHNLTGEETYELFEKYHILEYLHHGYDMLHTEGDAWLVNDIETCLKLRGYNL